MKLIFEGITGSTLYGTNTPDSDVDKRGVFIPDPQYIIGLATIKEKEVSEEEDTIHYELKQFFKLCIDNNPNIIELLFISNEFTLLTTPEWAEIVKNRHEFVSKKAKYTFSGYAFSQLKRIKSHRQWLLNPPTHKPTREEFSLPKNKTFSADDIGAFNVLIAKYLESISDIHPLKNILQEMNEWVDYLTIVQASQPIDINILRNITKGDISDTILYMFTQEMKYRAELNHYNKYLFWLKTRNPKRAKLEAAYGYDTKHAVHLVRLMAECEELLTTGNIRFPRPDAKFLKEVRNGYFKYDDLVKYADEMQAKFENLYKESTIQKTANYNKIDELLRKMYMSALIN